MAAIDLMLLNFKHKKDLIEGGSAGTDGRTPFRKEKHWREAQEGLLMLFEDEDITTKDLEEYNAVFDTEFQEANKME